MCMNNLMRICIYIYITVSFIISEIYDFNLHDDDAAAAADDGGDDDDDDDDDDGGGGGCGGDDGHRECIYICVCVCLHEST